MKKHKQTRWLIVSCALGTIATTIPAFTTSCGSSSLPAPTNITIGGGVTEWTVVAGEPSRSGTAFSWECVPSETDQRITWHVYNRSDDSIAPNWISVDQQGFININGATDNDIGTYNFKVQAQSVKAPNVKSNFIDVDIEIQTSYAQFSFTDNGDNTYSVARNVASTNFPNIVSIPSTYNSLPVTSVQDNAFYECEDLTSITIPNSVTSIGDSAFYDCENLTSIIIPDSVTSIGNWAFAYCVSLTSVTVPNSVTSIGDWVFAFCINLTSITILGDVVSIGDFAFNDCIDLTSITIPNSVTSIGEFAFARCNDLTSITIPTGVTSIGEYAFWHCIAFTSVTIPASTIEIADKVFADCTSLASATFLGNVPETGNLGIEIFENTNDPTVFVPLEYITAWQAVASNLGINADKILPIT